MPPAQCKYNSPKLASIFFTHGVIHRAHAWWWSIRPCTCGVHTAYLPVIQLTYTHTVNSGRKLLLTVRVRTMRNSARARKISKEQMLSTVRLAKSKALVATYLQLTKSLTVQSSKVRTQSSLPMPVPQRRVRSSAPSPLASSVTPSIFNFELKRRDFPANHFLQAGLHRPFPTLSEIFYKLPKIRGGGPRQEASRAGWRTHAR